MDLAKIGVLLIGVALMVLAVTAALSYLGVRPSSGPPPATPTPLNAYCVDRVVVISAHVDLRGVRVVDADGRVYCAFDRVQAGSDRVCRVGNTTLYLVEAGDISRAVFCRLPHAIRTPAGD
ncbi:MAG: hypothetical protein LM577_06130 [Thermoproteaceae archaeon]|jgi:hypothetical protein|nr:hypothetical protein [Thermoproteaceae archaeon]